MMDNKTCSVDILSVSLGEEGYLIIPRQTRELCEPLVKAADALEKALDTMRRAVNIGDGIRFQCGLEHTVSAGVDDSSRPSGLPKDTRASQFTGHNAPPQIQRIDRFY